MMKLGRAGAAIAACVMAVTPAVPDMNSRREIMPRIISWLEDLDPLTAVLESCDTVQSQQRGNILDRKIRLIVVESSQKLHPVRVAHEVKRIPGRRKDRQRIDVATP